MPPDHEAIQDLTATVYPFAQLADYTFPVALIDSPPQRRRLQPPSPKIERESTIAANLISGSVVNTPGSNAMLPPERSADPVPDSLQLPPR